MPVVADFMSIYNVVAIARKEDLTLALLGRQRSTVRL
jgi:hypothetical protein